MFSSKPHLIYSQIDEYVLWKSVRYPMVAGAEGALLRRLAVSFKLRSAEEISADVALFFAGEELSQFFTGRALIAIRAFLRYCRWAGYPCIHYSELDMRGQPGRPKTTTFDSDILRLKKRGLNPYQIHQKLQEQYPAQKIHRTNVYRWFSRVGG